MKNLMTEEDFSYRIILENGGSKELADKYLEYQNAVIKAENDLFAKVSTHKVMGELFDLINKKCNLNLHYTFSTKNIRGEDYIYFESVENLAKNNPILELAWYKFHINNFNGGTVWSKEFGLPNAKRKYSYFEAEDIDYSKPIEVGFSIDLHYSYEHQEGGSNGARLGWAYYNGNEWSIELDKDNEERKERRRRQEELDRRLNEEL